MISILSIWTIKYSLQYIDYKLDLLTICCSRKIEGSQSAWRLLPWFNRVAILTMNGFIPTWNIAVVKSSLNGFQDIAISYRQTSRGKLFPVWNVNLSTVTMNHCLCDKMSEFTTDNSSIIHWYNIWYETCGKRYYTRYNLYQETRVLLPRMLSWTQ